MGLTVGVQRLGLGLLRHQQGAVHQGAEEVQGCGTRAAEGEGEVRS